MSTMLVCLCGFGMGGEGGIFGRGPLSVNRKQRKELRAHFAFLWGLCVVNMCPLVMP